MSMRVYSVSESAKYSKHLISRVLHGAPIIEVIFLKCIVIRYIKPLSFYLLDQINIFIRKGNYRACWCADKSTAGIHAWGARMDLLIGTGF